MHFIRIYVAACGYLFNSLREGFNNKQAQICADLVAKVAALGL